MPGIIGKIRGVHSGKVVAPRNVHPEVREVLHELPTPDDGVNGRGHHGHIWLKDRENKVCKLRYARTDEDEAHEKPGERNAPEET